METQQRKINLSYRGQKGSSEVRQVCPVIDLNWQKMNERQERRETYYSRAEGSAVIVADTNPKLGSIFGDRIVIRGSPEYHF